MQAQRSRAVRAASGAFALLALTSHAVAADPRLLTEEEILRAFGGGSAVSTSAPVARPEAASPVRIEPRRPVREAAAKCRDALAPQPGALNARVQFENASNALTAESKRNLELFARVVAAHEDPAIRGGCFRIEGHTNTVGAAAYNQALSEKRAAAVAGYLALAGGLSSEQLAPVGLGETRPLPCLSGGDEKNRRVVISRAADGECRR